MTAHDPPQVPGEGDGVQAALEPQHGGQVVRGGARVEGLQEPEPLLVRRQGRRSGLWRPAGDRRPPRPRLRAALLQAADQEVELVARESARRGLRGHYREDRALPAARRGAPRRGCWTSRGAAREGRALQGAKRAHRPLPRRPAARHIPNSANGSETVTRGKGGGRGSRGCGGHPMNLAVWSRRPEERGRDRSAWVGDQRPVKRLVGLRWSFARLAGYESCSRAEAQRRRGGRLGLLHSVKRLRLGAPPRCRRNRVDSRGASLRLCASARDLSSSGPGYGWFLALGLLV